MNKYKIIFVRNEVIACDLLLTNELDFNGDYYYEQNNGHLIFAVIKADTVSQAVEKSEKIIKEVTDKTLGTTYVN